MNNRSFFRKRTRFLCAALLPGLFTCGAWATEIQLSPDVGQRSDPMYRAASYRRTNDRYRTQSMADYNLRLSHLYLRLTGTFDVVWNDNVKQSKNNRRNDVAIMPGLQLDVYWPINPGLVIRSGVFAQYQYWTNRNGKSGFQITGTQGALSAQLMADLHVGQRGTLTASEEYSRNISSIQVRALQPTNTSNFTLNQNVLGLQYRNDFSEYLSGTIELTHTNQWADQSQYKAYDLYSDFIDMDLMRRINSAVQVGPYVRGGIYRYTQHKHNNSNEYEGGVAAVYQKSQALAVSGSVGWQKVNFNNGNAPSATSDSSNVTCQVAARYSNSRYVTHLLTINYGADQGTLSPQVNFVKQLAANYTLSWEILKDLILNGNLGYVHSIESDGGEKADFYCAGLGTGYRVGKETTVSIYYTHEWKASSVATDEYAQNRIDLGLTHRF